MKYRFNIGNKEFIIEPYRTFQEKEILLNTSFENFNLDDALEILNFKTEYKLNNIEKKVILYKFREISLGDEIQVKFVCDKCKKAQEGVLFATDFIIEAKRDDSDIKKLNKKVNDENINEFIDFNADDLEIDKYDELLQRIKDNQIHFNFNKIAKCLYCQEEKIFDISPSKYLIEILSDDSLMSLYQTYSYLIFNGYYSKKDIDSMYPFERTIFVGLTNKIKEDLNNG